MCSGYDLRAHHVQAGLRALQHGSVVVLPLSLVTVTFGPRYRWHANHALSVYGEALVGQANGFRSVFPGISGATNASNSLAMQFGGGIDLRVKQHFAIRALDAAYVRTELPNGTDNIQNTLRLGAGLVFRFR